MANTISPEAATQLRVKFDTLREFAIERNLVDEHESISRSELRDRLQILTQSERRALHSRLRTRLRRLNELMAGERESFDAPRATGVNLTDEVTLKDCSA